MQWNNIFVAKTLHKRGFTSEFCKDLKKQSEIKKNKMIWFNKYNWSSYKTLKNSVSQHNLEKNLDKFWLLWFHIDLFQCNWKSSPFSSIHYQIKSEDEFQRKKLKHTQKCSSLQITSNDELPVAYPPSPTTSPFVISEISILQS